MDLALIQYGTKDVDTVLAWIMFAFVGIAASIVIFLLWRHNVQARKARRHKKNHGSHHRPNSNSHHHKS